MKIVQKRQIALLSFVISPKFTEVGRIIMHQSKLHALASIMSDEKLTMLCFHGGI